MNTNDLGPAGAAAFARQRENHTGTQPIDTVEGLEQALSSIPIFDTEEEGREAVQDGQYYYSVSDDPDVSKVLWRRVDADNSEFIADEPSTEFVEGVAATSNAAIDLASRPGLASGEFYADDDEQSVFSITDEDGNALVSWNQQGEMDAAPSLDMAEKSRRAQGEFHTSGDQPAFATVDEDGRPLYAVDENGQPIVPFISEFHTEDGQPAYAWTDKDGVVFYGIDEEGESVIGSGLIGDIKDNKLQLQPGRAWADGSFLRIQRPLDWPYSSNLDEFHNRDVNILHGFYDDLVAEFPEYVSREEEGEDGLGNKIYSYRFRPKNLIVTGGLSDNAVQPEYPKIVVVCGTHAGTERRQMWAGYIFVHDLCHSWQKEAMLEDIRWGCEFIIIPCLVPSALAAGSRRNHNGVDINRNFPQDWGDAISVNPESQMYKGPSAASELETQALLSFMEKHQDAVAGVDFHGFGTGGSNPDMPIFWVAASLNSTIGIAQKTILEMNAYARKNLTFLENLTDSEQSGRISTNAIGTVAYQFQISDGIDFVLLETHVGNWGTSFTRNQFHVDTLTKAVHKFYVREMSKRLDFYSIYEES